MTLIKFPSSRRPLICPDPAPPIPTLSSIATQIRAIADLFQKNCATIDQMGQQIQFLETRMRTLESTSAKASQSSYSTNPTPPQPMNNLTPRKTPFLPKLASQVIKSYGFAIFAFGLGVCLAFICNIDVDSNFITWVLDGFCRLGAIILLFLGVVAVQQSVR